MFIKVGFKLLAFIDRRKLSYRMGREDEEVRYRRWLSAKPRWRCGPLTVFNDLQSVRAFAFPHGLAGQIWRCLYIPHKGKQIYTPRSSAHINRLPEGTRLASRVILLNQEYHTG